MERTELLPVPKWEIVPVLKYQMGDYQFGTGTNCLITESYHIYENNEFVL